MLGRHLFKRKARGSGDRRRVSTVITAVFLHQQLPGTIGCWPFAQAKANCRLTRYPLQWRPLDTTGSLFYQTSEEGFQVQVINPVQTNSHPCLLVSVRQKKQIRGTPCPTREVIRFGHTPENVHLPSENIYELRELCRGRHAIVSMQADVKRKVVALDQVLPGPQTAFTNLIGEHFMAILQKRPTPKNYPNAS